MPDTGAPGAIWFPDDTAPVAPLEGLFSQLATSVNIALTTLGKPIYLTKTAMDAVPGTVKGQRATVSTDSTASNNRDYTWSGTAWVALPTNDGPFAKQIGLTSNGATVAAGGSTTQAITFATGRFTQPPSIQPTPWNGRFSISIISVTATGAVLGINNNSAGPGIVGAISWTAEQMTASSAVG